MESTSDNRKGGGVIVRGRAGEAGVEEGSSVGVGVGVGVTALDEGPGVGAGVSLALPAE